MTPTTNKEILQNHIDNIYLIPNVDIKELLIDIQSKLIEPMEYEIGSIYEFSDDGKIWEKRKFLWYVSEAFRSTWRMNYIRPIQVPPEITSAISLLEATGEYVITKK